MITAERMAIVDRNAEALGVDRRLLMESSGNAVATTVRELVDPGAAVLFMCGPGNNGGDAFVAARFLDEYDVSVRLVGSADQLRTDIATANWEALQAAALAPTEWRDSTAIDLPAADLVVDALVGTGISGELREPIATAVRAINVHDAPVLSVDVPSGFDTSARAAAGDMIAADRVVTFHDLKPGLTELDADVTVADIGIPEAAELFVDRGDLLGVDRDPDSHKGDAGRILVIGGGPFTGAPALAGTAALKAGADLAFVACPSRVSDTIAGYGPDLIVEPFDGDRLQPDHIDELASRATETDVVVLGPGLGDQPATREAVADFLGQYEGRVVVDADAIAAVPDTDTAASVICTPHAGEFRELGGTAVAGWRDRIEAVSTVAERLGVTILLKGPDDVITDGDRVRVSRTGNPGMTVGGTGDVLAGVTAGLFAAPARDPVTAGAIAAYATGRAGDFAHDHRGYGLVASNVMEEIPAALWPADTLST